MLRLSNFRALCLWFLFSIFYFFRMVQELKYLTCRRLPLALSPLSSTTTITTVAHNCHHCPTTVVTTIATVATVAHNCYYCLSHHRTVAHNRHYCHRCHPQLLPLRPTVTTRHCHHCRP
jgi:hypothetical protein